MNHYDESLSGVKRYLRYQSMSAEEVEFGTAQLKNGSTPILTLSP